MLKVSIFFFLFSVFNLGSTLFYLIFIHPASITMRSGLVCLLGLAGVALTNALSLEKRDNLAVLEVPMVRDTSRQLYSRLFFFCHLLSLHGNY